MADADLQLFSSTKERRRYTDLADFYAIIKATEHLEKAYARDAIDEARYEKACLKLISQFKSSESALKLGGGIEDASSFIAEWRMDCPRARDRLVRCGAPATVLHATDAGDASETVRVAECVQHFITAMDALKLDQRAVDEVQPLVADLAAGLGRVPHVPCAAGKAALAKWLVQLNAMRASAEIDDEQARQLSFDLDCAYSEFHRDLAGRH